MKEGLYVPIAATSNVLLLNGEGDIVDELHVTVTPNEVKTVNIIRGGGRPSRGRPIIALAMAASILTNRRPLPL